MGYNTTAQKLNKKRQPAISQTMEDSVNVFGASYSLMLGFKLISDVGALVT